METAIVWDLTHFGLWLRSDAPKVGTNINGWERPALANSGYELRGIAGDTLDMSRLLNPAQTLEDGEGHDLKAWGQRLGYRVITFDDVAGRPEPGVLSKDGLSQKVRWSKRELVPLPELWELYPQRHRKIMEYATQDAAMSLSTYWHIRRKLEARQ